MSRHALSLLALTTALGACDPLAGLDLDLGCFLCVGPSLDIPDNVYVLKGDTVRVRASWSMKDPRGSWSLSDQSVAAFEVAGALVKQVDGPVDHVLLRALRSNAGFILTLTPAANPELYASVSLSVVDSSLVDAIVLRYAPTSDTVQLKIGVEISIEPTLWTGTGVRVIGWPESITVSDTLVIAELPPPSTGSPRVLHVRAMRAGSSRLTAAFGQAAKTVTFVVSP